MTFENEGGRLEKKV